VFPGNDVLQFRPKGIIDFVRLISTNGFPFVHFTQGGVSDRSTRNSALG